MMRAGGQRFGVRYVAFITMCRCLGYASPGVNLPGCQPPGSNRMPSSVRRTDVSRPRRAFTLGVVAAAVAVALTGCSVLGSSKPDAGPVAQPSGSVTATPSQPPASQSPSPSPSASPSDSDSPAAPGAASVVITAGGSTVSDAKIDIVAPLAVAATDATLTSVKVTGGSGDVTG